MLDLSNLSDFGLGWLEASGPSSDIVLSTRVRLARNLQGHPFSPKLRDPERRQIFEQIRQATERTALKGGIALDVSALSPLSARELPARHLAPTALAVE